MAEGVVKWFSDEKGYGYLTVLDLADHDDPRVNHQDVLVHRSDIQTNHWPTLDNGQHVAFAVERTPQGLRARRVLVLDDSLPEYLTRTLPRPESGRSQDAPGPGRAPGVPGLIEPRRGPERFILVVTITLVVVLVIVLVL